MGPRLDNRGWAGRGATVSDGRGRLQWVHGWITVVGRHLLWRTVGPYDELQWVHGWITVVGRRGEEGGR